jgi:hypothetical protein
MKEYNPDGELSYFAATVHNAALKNIETGQKNGIWRRPDSPIIGLWYYATWFRR